MKKKDIVSLIRYHAENNEIGFKNEAYKIAREFDESGDYQLSEYIMSLLSDVNSFVPQGQRPDLKYMEHVARKEEMLLLPDGIMHDMLGIVNAIDHHIGINKFLFEGAPGTGKTEAVKQLARILNRELYMVDFSMIVDSKLGQTQKNLSELFQEMNDYPQPDKILVLFDEIDAIALDRTNSSDLREMGRATSAMLKEFDRMNENIILVATTNLFDHFDKALSRRFDSIINFNRYSQKDLMTIAEKLLDQYLSQLKLANRDVRLFRKVMSQMNPLPYPGDLKNLIKTSVAFSDPSDGMDYFRRLYTEICGHSPDNIQKLKAQNFTIREIAILMNKSKSSIDRELKAGVENESNTSTEGEI